LSEEVLDGMHPLVREQIEERQGWHRRILADRTLPTEQQAEAYGELGVLYQGYTLVEPARAAFENARRLNPKDPRWPYYLGHIQWRENQPEAAIGLFEEALELAPGEAPIHVRLGEVLLEQGRLDEADGHFAAAAEAGDNATALFNRGQIASQQGETQKAVDFFQQTLALAPDATSVHAPLAVAYRQLGDVEKAQQHLEQRGEGTVRLKDPWMERPFFLSTTMRQALEAGEALYRNGQFGEALQAYRQATAADPLCTRPRMRLATTLVQMAEAARSVEGQEEVVAGALNEALKQYRIVLQIQPEHPRAHTQMAYLLVQQGQLNRAEEHYRAALEADPDSHATWVSLGNLQLDEGRPADALDAFTTVLAVEPTHPAARLGEARALLGLGRAAEARDRLREGLELLPEDTALAHTLARLLATASDSGVRNPAQALPLAVAVYREQPTALHGETLAMALAAEGKFREAAELQAKLLEQVAGAGDTAYATVLRANLERYRSGQGAVSP
jgi:tetratricopeptide (TPR) repeat protein